MKKTKNKKMSVQEKEDKNTLQMLARLKKKNEGVRNTRELLG